MTTFERNIPRSQEFRQNKRRGVASAERVSILGERYVSNVRVKQALLECDK